MGIAEDFAHAFSADVWDPNRNGVANALDPNKNGVADAFDPNKNGVGNFFTKDLPNGLKAVGDAVLPLVSKLPFVGPLVGGLVCKIPGMNCPKASTRSPAGGTSDDSSLLPLVLGGGLIVYLLLR